MATRAGRRRATFVALLVLVAAWAGPGSTGAPLLSLLDTDHGLLAGLGGPAAGPGPSGGHSGGFALPPAGGYPGYASGTVLSANVGGVVDLVHLNVASADAAFRSGASAPPAADETGRPASPALPDR